MSQTLITVLALVLGFGVVGTLGFYLVRMLTSEMAKLQEKLALNQQASQQQSQSQIQEVMTLSRMETQSNLNIAMQDIVKKIDGVRVEVDKKLSETVTKNFESFGAVSKRLEELGVITGQVVNLSQGVRDLSRILESPKLRGSMGEFQLSEMLKQVLPDDVFEEQYVLDSKSREAVDAVIKLKEGLLCIDSKFPLNNARRILEEDLGEVELKEARKAFSQDVKIMVDSISSKYIVADKTLDFALMFIPAESVFYELMRDSLLHQYCLKKHVIPVSPNSFYAYLQVIAVGFRGLKIQSEAKKIEGAILVLKKDFERFSFDFGKVGKHLKDAQTQYQNVEDRVTKFGVTIQRLGLNPEARDSAPAIATTAPSKADFPAINNVTIPGNRSINSFPPKI